MSSEADFDVGARLSAVRKMHHISQRELAKRAGVTNGTISLIEQNRVSPSVSSLRKVLQGLPMSFSDFFSLEAAPRQDVFFAAVELLEIGCMSATRRAAIPGAPCCAMSQRKAAW